MYHWNLLSRLRDFVKTAIKTVWCCISHIINQCSFIDTTLHAPKLFTVGLTVTTAISVASSPPLLATTKINHTCMCCAVISRYILYLRATMLAVSQWAYMYGIFV